MGLFSRQNRNGQAAASTKHQPRTNGSGGSQARALRVKARRRLAGALAMVLAAVVALPMVLDSEPVPVANDIPVSIPEMIARPALPSQPGEVLASATTGTEAQQGSAETAPPAAPEAPLNLPPVTPPARTPPQPAAPAVAAAPKPAAPATEAARQQPARQPAPAPIRETPASRTDDGAVALALLEGRNVQGNSANSSPARASNATSQRGSFVLQVAAYTTEAAAVSRRDALHAAGITNAYVEPVTAGGKRQFRLRVGTFPSRDAAQAAQARLRTLGYDNGFIAPQ